MKTPENIVAFNNLVKVIFAELYRVFPEPLDFKAADLIAAAELGEEYAARLARPSSGRHNIAASTLRFLAEEGFIRFRDDVAGQSFHGCALTVKGFTALRRVPKTIDTEATIGDRFLEPLAQGVTAALVQVALSPAPPVF